VFSDREASAGNAFAVGDRSYRGSASAIAVGDRSYRGSAPAIAVGDRSYRGSMPLGCVFFCGSGL
jgi:hypothetical protein